MSLNLKKLVCLFTSLLLLSSVYCSAYAQENTQESINNNHSSAEVYYEEKSYSYSDISKLSDNQIIQKSDSNYKAVSESLDKIRSEKNGNLKDEGIISTKTLYIGIDSAGKERKLTYNDLNQINQFKKASISNFTASISSPVKDTYACTFVLNATPYSNGKGYSLHGSLSWNYPPSMFIGNQRPADGDDAAGFSWGGGYDYNSIYTSRTYRFKETDTYRYNEGTLRNINGVANASRGWAFPEFINWGYDKYDYLTRGDFQMNIFKSSMSGGTTKCYFDIVHTYSSHSYSFSIGGSISGPSASISVSPTDNQWSDFVEVTINK